MTRWIVLAVLLVLAGVGVCCFLVKPRERLIQGRTEDAWIASIEYRGDDQQTEQWRLLGLDGLQMLIRTLRRGNSTWEKAHVRYWNRLPGFLMRLVPPPPDDTNYSTRMRVAMLLCNLQTNARPVVPQIVHALTVERSEQVRQILLSCFEPDNLSGMDKPKRDLLPELVRASQSAQWPTRNNGLVAMRWYSNRTDVVVPILVNALQDTNANVRHVAAASLQRADPSAAAQVGVK